MTPGDQGTWVERPRGDGRHTAAVAGEAARASGAAAVHQALALSPPLSSNDVAHAALSGGLPLWTLYVKIKEEVLLGARNGPSFLRPRRYFLARDALLAQTSRCSQS